MLVSDSPKEKPGSGRKRAFVAFWLLCGLAITSGLLYCLYQQVRVSSAIAAIRKRGEPVTPDEISFPPRAVTSRFEENVASFQAVSGRAWVDILSASQADGFLAAPDSARLDAETIAALKDLRDCLDARAKARADPDTFELSPLTSSIADGDDPSECERRAHRVRRLCLEPAIDAAIRLCVGDPVDFGAVVGEWVRNDPSKEPWPDAHTEPVRLAARYLENSAVDLALENRGEEAVSRWRAALHGLKTIERGPWLMKFAEWHRSELEALDGLRAILQCVPAGLDVHDLEAELDPETPRRNLIQAIRGERAFMNRMFARFAMRHSGTGGVQLPWEPLRHFAWTAYIHRDQASYLELIQGVIEGAKSPYWTWKEQEGRNQLFSRIDRSIPWSSAFAMILTGVIEGTAKVEAELLLARAALAAYRGGADAGVRVAGSSTDPFSGQPIQSRVESNGTLVLSSAGRNPETVWRVPAR
jgi:hypothetical protein